ncbi:1,4-alpha-glucan-branching enzyme [Candidatus Moduliflexus flocculans]|uniref:1,4-alpha-glucan-branching enzyme n=1 Tax=Candidatus Moduliflexus flocculans TaxID=1499966 RepID=A0A0S6VVM6_9BACT|nr:1,4-alpha-glucan-branching enzyme [Candidatus Moduliflexus flocculans]
MRKNLEREEETLIFVCNFTPIPRNGYRIGAPLAGHYDQLLNSDDWRYGGSGVVMEGGATTDELPWQGLQYSLNLTLPPLGMVVLKPQSVSKPQSSSQ